MIYSHSRAQLERAHASFEEALSGVAQAVVSTSSYQFVSQPEDLGSFSSAEDVEISWISGKLTVSF